jgi:hypothetical protein
MSWNPDPVDTDVDNYTISELLDILGINEPDSAQIIQKSDFYINKMKNQNNTAMASFFQDIKTNLLEYSKQLNDEKAHGEPVSIASESSQTSNWWANESLAQTGNSNQSDKNTDRKQKIDVYNNPHVPMNKQQLGVANQVSVPVVQDVLNPNLKNIISRIIILDSQYRQSSSPNETSTDYSLDLSEPLLNVLSLRLYSYSIPYSWYNIDISYGNTCFWITMLEHDDPTNSISVPIYLTPGTYTTSDIVQQLTNSFTVAGFIATGIMEIPEKNIPPQTPFYLNNVTGKITMNLCGATFIYDSKTYTILPSSIITFFDATNSLACNNINLTMAINQTLGWILGFRLPSENAQINGNTSVAIPELYGPKYFIIVLDDLNQNHINNGLIGITELSKNVKLPSYYSPDMPIDVVPANPFGNNLSTNSIGLENDAEAGILLVEKLNATYSPSPRVLPTAPRTLTQSQIYSINEIIKNNDRTTDFRLKSPCVSDTFAIIPLKIGSSSIGDVITEFGGTMQDNKRIYFGPVNISRLRIKLLDDKGNIVNLNGCDWCITLISENLYQY